MDKQAVSGAPLEKDALLSSVAGWESLSLKNRLSQSIDVKILCRLFNGRFNVFIETESLGETRRLEKSSEHIAQQVVGRLGAKPEDVSIVLHQSGEPRGWWRWCFHWVGNAPLKSSFVELTEAAQERLLARVVNQGAVFSVVSGVVTQVA